VVNLYFLILVEFVECGKEMEVERDIGLFVRKDNFG
jgi:hypothetical protein